MTRNKSTFKAIADEWELLEHDPKNPAWKGFVGDILVQWQAMRANGLRVLPVEENPYKQSQEMFVDVHRRNTLKVWTGGSELMAKHPLAERAFVNEGSITLNTVFRAVHDYYGHFVRRNPFETLEGELAAYCEHRRMFRVNAVPALFGETVGQLAYYHVRGEFVPEQKAVCFGADFLEMV